MPCVCVASWSPCRCAARRVLVDGHARRVWPWLPPVATPGGVWIGPCGERVRVLDDGTAEEIGEAPRRWSIAADPCATAIATRGRR